MKSRLRFELHQFLEKERISLESGIVNDLTYRLAGIEVTSAQQQVGFNLAASWYETTEKEKIIFTIPEQFSLTQIKKLLAFFDLPEESYQYKQGLVLNNQYVFEKFLPEFKKLFEEMKEKSLEDIVKYKISSAAILESTAQNTLSKYIEETKKIVLADNLKELTPTMESLIDFILLLSGRMKALETFPLFYKNILNSCDTLNKFLCLQEIKDNQKLSAQLKMILDGMELYARYHRVESVLANIAFRRELTQFLTPYCISTAKCDLVEHAVLALAGAEIYPQSRCHYFPGDGNSDRARFVITFDDITQDNANKVLDYMRRLGDETAHEGYGSRRYGSALERGECVLESAIDAGGDECAFFDSDMPGDRRPTTKRIPESHSIEMDGKFFYECVFPKLKDKIALMDAQNMLTRYQELSKELFKQSKETAPVISVLSMFSKQVSPAPEVTSLIAETPSTLPV